MTFLPDVIALIAEMGKTSREIWFRGQGDASWPLVPSLLRANLPPEQERQMLARFRYRAMGMVHEYPGDEDAARWLFLMQHHGLPTRLLDWSESALFALFFAITDNPNADGRLFVLLPTLLNEQQTGKRELIAPTMPPSSEIMSAAFNGAKGPKNVVAVSTYASEDRLARQRSGFTVHGVGEDLQTLAPAGAIRSIVIPSAMKRSLAETLAYLGVTRTTLFHDLDSLAAELREQYGIG